MKREALWAIIRERGVMDREAFLDAWRGTNNTQVLDVTNAEIARFGALKGKSFKESLDADREGVRLAFLSAELWFLGSSSAQVGGEKRHATAMYKRVYELRLKLFGKTRLETMLGNTVTIPMHKITEMQKSGLAPSEFLANLTRQ